MMPHRLGGLGLASAACTLVIGCVDRPISKLPPTSNTVETKHIAASANRNVDLLFVVDDSGSMKAEQDSLRAHFKDFIARLSSFDGGLPDVHIGIISTDVGTGPGTAAICSPLGDDGKLLTHDCAGLDAGATFLSDVAGEGGTRVKNYSGDLADVFACMADLGTKGCGAEQPLESMRLALDPARNKNPGFLRDDSLLAIVIISDEDDCSTRDRAMFTLPGDANTVVFGCTKDALTCDEDPGTLGDKHHCVANPNPKYLFPVDDYVNLLDQLRPDASRLLVAAIAGQAGCVRIETNPDPKAMGAPYLAQLHECDSTIEGAAYPAQRTHAFLESFTNPAYVPIGNGDIAAALDSIAKSFGERYSWCFDQAPADVNPTRDGPQYDCSVTEIQHRLTKDEVQTVIGACDATHSRKPCWTLAEDADTCAKSAAHMKLDVDRGGAAWPPDTTVDVQCVTQ